MSVAMTPKEREAFLADVHVGVIAVAEEGRGPLSVPVWYSYEPGGEVRLVTGRTSRKGRLLACRPRHLLTSTSASRDRSLPSRRQTWSAIVGLSHAGTSAAIWAINTSRAHDQSMATTCSFACAQSGG
jgi:nitroimidazol reductase NimA-like FMN-containing flavoprotein (pyridoxamine 5'-phosphate oxidase superfamily)